MCFRTDGLVLTVLPEWSRVFSPCRFHSTLFPLLHRGAPESEAAISAGSESSATDWCFQNVASAQADAPGGWRPCAAFWVNRPGFPGECFICELRLPDHRFRWKHNKLFLLLPEEYGPAFPAIVDCYTSPPTLVWPVPLLHGFSSSYGVLPPLCKDH